MTKFEIQLTKQALGASLLLKTAVDEPGQIESTIRQMAEELNKLGGVQQIASVSEAMPFGIAPGPTLDASVSEKPVLESPPQNYKPSDATREIMNPSRSQWAQKSRLVTEMQAVLIELGVRGVSDYNTFDSVVRALHRQGFLKREKVGRAYQYYVPAGR